MMHGTTILAIRHGGKVVVVGDGQVSLGQTVMKRSARKVRKLHHDRVIAGFAGATADAFTLFEKFEGRMPESLLKKPCGSLQKSASILTISLPSKSCRSRLAGIRREDRRSSKKEICISCRNC